MRLEVAMSEKVIDNGKLKMDSDLSEWKKIELSQIARKVTSGGTPSTKVSEYYNGDIPWLNTKEVSFNRITSTEKTITESGLKNSSAKWIEKNSVIVAMYGATAAKVAINKIPLTTNQACCNIIINQELADYNFVFYALWNNYDDLENIAVGAAQQNLSVGVISRFPILLPPLPEQRAIASVLSSLDDKIDLLHRQNKTLEQMAETLFRQWFVEEAEEDWEEITLYDAIELVGGGTPKTTIDEYWNGKIKWLSGGDIAANHKSIITSSVKTITEEGLQNSSAKLLPKFSTVISARGTVGKYCILSEPMAYSQSNYGVKPKFEGCYFFTYLLINHSVEELNSAAYGSVFDTITTNTFRGIEISVPPKEEIQLFESKIKNYFFKILNNKQQICTLDKLRDTLLPKLMSGEVRVKYKE